MNDKIKSPSHFQHHLELMFINTFLHVLSKSVFLNHRITCRDGEKKLSNPSLFVQFNLFSSILFKIKLILSKKEIIELF